MAGLELDPWQCLVLEHMLAVREETYWDEVNGCAENRWAASEFGLVVSRQNGKGAILEARELAGLFLFGEKQIIHSAHLFDTSQKHFERIRRLIEDTPELRREVLQIKAGHGQEGIYLRSGQSLLFKARSGGAGRGFSADLLVFDEAMKNLDSEVIEAAMPMVSARPNSQVLYTGSAGTRNSEHFGRARNRALRVLNGEAEEIRFGWMEWSAELHSPYCTPDCDQHDAPDDPKTWAKSNPAMNFRPGLTEEYIREQEYKSMSAFGFAKERLSVGDWPSEGGGWRVISKDEWGDQKTDPDEYVGKFALAIDCSPEGENTAPYACITAAGATPDNQVLIEITGDGDQLYDYNLSGKWVVDRVLKIWRAQKPAFVVINPATPAGQLVDELEAEGVKVLKPTAREYAQACGDFKTAVAPRAGEDPSIVHIDQAPLNLAVANADRRAMQELWAWDKTTSAADITPLTCATLAVWGYRKHIYRKGSVPMFGWV